MALYRITMAQALARWGDFDELIDARSESEYALDHLPGAVNWPTLTDFQHRIVGHEYTQVSPFEARKRGAAMAARNIAAHIDRELPHRPRDWRPLLYCWRGGQRSGALALILDQIGFPVHVLEGGYREFRRAVVAELAQPPAQLALRVVCGRTGTAKSRLLQTLAAAGEQVLDLEALACHRGSVLGLLPGQPQPAQKAFETRVWQALRGFDPRRVVYAESESRTIGRLRVPEALLLQLRASPCIHVEMPLAERVRFLLQDYAHFVADPQALCQRLDALRELRGKAVVERWQAQALAGDMATMVEELLTQHYDPVYLKSMQRNFLHFGQALPLPLPNGDEATLQAAADKLLAATSTAARAEVAGEGRAGATEATHPAAAHD